MDDVRWLDEREGRAWRNYLTMRELLDLQIGRDLATSSGLSTADYHVLATLSAAEDHRMRLIDLGAGMSWSTSRIAHHASRMEKRGLISRDAHPTNSRAVVIALTPAGLDLLREAAPGHVASVREHFIDLLTDQQVDALNSIAETVVEHLRSR